MMIMTNKLKEFIEENIELVDALRIEELYDKCPEHERGNLSDILIDIELNPLIHLKSVKAHAFSCCDSLTSVEIPSNITSIEKKAFCYCLDLKSVIIPNSVTSIGWHAFDSCTSLTSIEIPNSVTSIGSSAFEGCTSLTSITIPSSVTYIGDFAFNHCPKLVEIRFNKTVSQLKSERWNINKGWQAGSRIKKIICTDGEIEL